MQSKAWLSDVIVLVQLHSGNGYIASEKSYYSKQKGQGLYMFTLPWRTQVIRSISSSRKTQDCNSSLVQRAILNLIEKTILVVSSGVGSD